MGYSIFACMAMWVGYKVAMGHRVFKSSCSINSTTGSLLGSDINFQPDPGPGRTVGYLFKLYLLSVGLYGRLDRPRVQCLRARSTNFAHSQTRFLRNFSILPFTLICLQYFKDRTPTLRLYFIITLALEIFFAFIYGARAPIVIITLVVFFTYYYNVRRLKVLAVLPIVGVVVLAFTIVQEFKEFAQATTDSHSSPVELLESFVEFRENMPEKRKAQIYDDVKENIVRRMNFVTELAMALRYAEQGLDSDDPNFTEAILMIPVDIVVPKFLQGKAKPSWGYWFKIQVLRRSLAPGIQYCLFGNRFFKFCRWHSSSINWIFLLWCTTTGDVPLSRLWDTGLPHVSNCDGSNKCIQNPRAGGLRKLYPERFHIPMDIVHLI